MADSSQLARNTTFLTIASIFQKALSFIYFAYLAKILSSEIIGQYQAVLGLCGFFIVLMDFGLGPVLTREAAKSEEQLPNIFKKIFGAKIFLIIFSLLALILTANILHFLKPNNYTTEDVYLIYIGGIIIVIDTLVFTFFCIFRALKNMQYEAFNIIIYQGIIFCCGITSLIFTNNIIYLLLVLILGSLFELIFFTILIKKKTKIIFTGIFSWQNFKSLIIISAPFAISGIFVKLNGTIDMQMLKYMLTNGNHYVGLYTLAFKLTFALTVLSGSFASSYFPTISYYINRDLNKVREIFENGFAYMMMLSLPITAGVLVLADKLILTIWSDNYFDSILPLKIYISALIFIFINYPVGNYLNAINKQILNTTNTGIALIINVILNYFLIPKYNIIGTCIAALISNLLLVSLGLPWVYKYLKFSILNIVKKFSKIFAASLCMGIIVYYINTSLNFHSGKSELLICFFSGIISYILLIFIFKAISLNEFKKILSSIKR